MAPAPARTLPSALGGVDDDRLAGHLEVGRGAAHHPLEAHLGHAHGAGLREREEVVEDALQVIGLVADLVEVLPQRRVRRGLLGARQIAAQRGEAVPHLVSDAGGELSHVGEALRQPALLGAALHVGGVGEEHEIAAHLLRLAPQLVHGDAETPRLGSGRHHHLGAGIDLVTRERRGEDRGDLGAVDQHVVVGLARDRLVDAEQRATQGVERQDAALRRDAGGARSRGWA